MSHNPRSGTHFTPATRPMPAITLVGGSVRAAASDAAAAGYRLHACDHFGDADLLAVCDHWTQLERTDAWSSLVQDADATIVPTGGFDWPADNAYSHRGLIAFPSRSTFDAMRSPDVLRQLANQAGVGFPQSLTAEEISPATATDRCRWLVKPKTGTGGLGIRDWNGSTDSTDSAIGPHEYLQQRISGRALGVNFFSRLSRGRRSTTLLGCFFGLTHRKNRAHRWLYGGSWGPLRPTDSRLVNSLPQVEQLGHIIADRFNLVGLFNVDLIITDQGDAWLLEINPRYSASMELLNLDGKLIDGHLAAYEEQSGLLTPQQADQRLQWLGDIDHSMPPANVALVESACKRIIYAISPSRFDQSQDELNRLVADLLEPWPITATFHDLPATSATIPAGYPIMTVIARGTELPSTLVKQSFRIAARVRQVLVIGRQA